MSNIYSQAVVKWNVEPLNGMPTVELGENGLDWADKSMLSSYNAEMNSVISAFKTWKTDADRDAYYLFIVPKFSEGSVEGFMPRNRSFGFITKEQIVDRTVAHELGHGAFNLHHTFSSSGWGITEKSTDNLMDYNSGTKLWKPQWDYIHNPEATTGLFDGMEDGAYMAQVVQCLSGAAVDFALYYSITWVSMFFDDEIKEAPSLVDFSKVTGYKEFSWKEAGVSAGTSCIASVIPALSSSDNVKKLSLAISAFAGAAEGMATELAKQYDITSARLQKEGKSSSMSDVIAQIDWVPVLSNAGISAAVTAFSTYVVTNPKYAVLLNRIKEKLKVTGSNFSEELLGYINKKLGRVVSGAGIFLDDLKLKNLIPELPTGSFVNSTKFNVKALKIDPPANSRLKQLAEEVKIKGDIDIPGGSKTEEIQDILFMDAGYTPLDGKVNGNNGFDGLYIKGDIENPTEIVIGEAKQWSSSGGAALSPSNPSTGLPKQMSDDWIQDVASRIRTEANKLANKELKEQKLKIADMLQKTTNSVKIQKYLTVVNKSTGEINILKLGKF